MKVLLVSLPGIYPSFPAVGLEMIAQGLREKGHSPAVINGHLEIIKFIDGRLLRSLCQQNIWDLLYSFLVYPDARVGLRSKSVLTMLTTPSQGYQLTEDELVRIASAIGRFNHHLIRRIAAFPAPFLIGFNVQNNQLLVAKFFAREAKAIWGGAVHTLVGGASVRDGLGRSIVIHHSEFDFAAEENGVRGIDEILRGNGPPLIRGFFFRGMDNKPAAGDTGCLEDGRVKESDLNYDEFYAQRKGYEKSRDFSVFHPWDGIPAMLASGCRWSRCRFCNLRQKYEPFSIREVCDSIGRRSRATGIPKVFLLDLSQPGSRILQEFFRELESEHASYLFGAMFRCDIQKRDLIRFKKNGLDICHLGIESYSDRLLQKMNKGVRLIDIVKTLVTCAEEGIRCEGNLLVNLPWENAEDIAETGRNLTLLSHLPLPRIISYKLSHGSIAYNSPDRDHRLNWVPELELRYAYPPSLRGSVETMYYSKRKLRLDHERLWLDVIKKYKRYTLYPPHLLYEVFRDGLLIHDTRYRAAKKRWFVPGVLAAQLYQYCKDIHTIAQIERHFSAVPDSEIARMLRSFVSRKVMIQSDDRFLSIALRRT
jgi:hypothetical protein